jgi:hypothetical protein
MRFEYKAIGAPEKARRRRGLRRQSDRVAAAFEEVLQAEAVDGWEYLRTDQLPVTERAGWFRRGREVQRAVMVFRRPLDRAAPVESEATPRRAPVAPPAEIPAAPPAATPVAPPAPVRAPELGLSEDPDLRMADFVRGPGQPKPKG